MDRGFKLLLPLGSSHLPASSLDPPRPSLCTQEETGAQDSGQYPESGGCGQPSRPVRSPWESTQPGISPMTPESEVGRGAQGFRGGEGGPQATPCI